MKCQQITTQYGFGCSSPATFRVRWIEYDESGVRVIRSFRSCAQHLGKACREAAANGDNENTGRVQVTDLNWKAKRE